MGCMSMCPSHVTQCPESWSCIGSVAVSCMSHMSMKQREGMCHTHLFFLCMDGDGEEKGDYDGQQELHL